MPPAKLKPKRIDLPIPLAGIDKNSSASQQTPGTSPQLKNVRPWDCVTGRRRLSRRPGFTKYITERVAAADIQDINTVTIGEIESTGDAFSFGGTSTSARIFDATQLDTAPDYDSTTTIAIHSMGCTDENNNFYVASVATRTITLQKVGTDYAEKWGTITLTLAAGGSPGDAAIVGLCCNDGIVYLLVTSATAAAIAAPGIYRFYAHNGAAVEAGPWKPAVGTTGLLGTYTMPATVRAAQCMCVGTGILSTVGKVGTNLAIQQWDTDTGALLSETTLEAFNTSPARMIVDHGNNVYVLSNATIGGTDQKLYRLSSSTVLGGGSYPVSLSGAVDIAYEPIGFQICVVGDTLAGDAHSFKRFLAETGVYQTSSGWQPGGFGAWSAVTCDGLGDTGTCTLRRSVAAGNVDLINFNGTVATGSNWTLISNLGTAAARYWIVAAGLKVAAEPSPMQSNRRTRILVLADGDLYRVDGGHVSNIKNDLCLSNAPVVFSVVHNFDVLFVDGRNYSAYGALTNVAGGQTVNVGSTMPTDENGNKCRINGIWRDRYFLSALETDPYNWFFSAMGDSGDWDIAPVSETVEMAIDGNSTECGKCPDKVTGFIPCNANLAFLGAEQSIHMFVGDPADFGRMDLVSDVTGMSWGRAWTKDPAGIIYFFGSVGGVYRMSPAGAVEKISTPLDADFQAIDQSKFYIRLVWDEVWMGFHVIVSPKDATKETVHYWWNSSGVGVAAGWWPDEFANPDHNALAVHVLDGDDPNDRILLWGGRDGYIRALRADAKHDDGTAIDSQAFIGPVQMKAGGVFYLDDLDPTMSESSGPVNYRFRSSHTAEAAFAADGRFLGRLSAGHNRRQPVNSRGHAQFMELYTNEKALPWSVETMRGRVIPLPESAARMW